ncbi:MAG TPA: FtsW/RodA/SpoVE family cell cycle protein [Firmicutes bacterium]|nr:FtsW/RodA/SpoVE family cell cycle protein [Bacillota bacterium]
MTLSRQTERSLLWAVFVLGWLAFILSWLAVPVWEPQALLYPVAITLALYLVHCSLVAMGSYADELLLPLMAVPIFLGVATLYRLDRASAFWQVVWVLLGLCPLLLLQLVSGFKAWRPYWALFMLGGLGCLAITLFFGTEAYGAKIWLKVGPVSFQPSEPAKILLSLALAGYLATRKELLLVRSWKLGPVNLPHPAYFGPLTMALALALLLMVVQRDLGTGLLLFGLFVCELYVAAPRWDYLLLGILALAGGSIVSYRLFDHVRVRFDIWLNPWEHASGQGYQLVQAMLSTSAGGLLGAGFGQGWPQVIPAVTTDLTFVAWCEETGLAGAVALIIVYMLLVQRGFKAALTTDDDFLALAGVGLTSLFALQSLVILGGALRLIPLTGVTLPLFNYGGSSLVSTLFSFGFLLRLSAEGRA